MIELLYVPFKIVLSAYYAIKRRFALRSLIKSDQEGSS